MTQANGWPLVPLGELLKPTTRRVCVSADTEYELLGARWYAKGLYTKEKKLGNEIKASHLYRVEQGDFVYNRLFAWKGSFAIATQENDGCFVSNEFPCFHVCRDRLIPQFLWYYFSREAAWDQALGQSYGATPTSRNRLKESDLLRLTIPLPPLEEQRRIVAKLDRLAAKIEEAKCVREKVLDGAKAFLRGVFARATAKAKYSKMQEVAPLVRRRVELNACDSYPELGIRSFGKGTFHKPTLDALEVGTKKIYRIEPGDLVFNNVFAWEGAIAVAQPEDAGRFGSHRFITCVPVPGVVTAEFLCFYFLTPEGLDKIGKASPGGAGRNRTLGLEKLAEIEVPIPAYEVQARFDRLQRQVKALIDAHHDEMAKLDAMLPSILDRAFKGAL